MYGFADEAERATFRSLIEVQGVGAATARLLLSSMSPEELQKAVATDDARTLGRVKGIGPKTAQRLVLELKGKLALTAASGSGAVQTSWRNTTEDDALIALVNLGIARAAAEAAVKKVPDASGLPVEELVKKALRAL
jgi:Holliday junction DNA helicase RuvA